MFAETSIIQVALVTATVFLVAKPQDLPKMAYVVGKACGRTALMVKEVRRFGWSALVHDASGVPNPLVEEAKLAHEEFQVGMVELRRLSRRIQGEWRAPLTAMPTDARVGVTTDVGTDRPKMMENDSVGVEEGATGADWLLRAVEERALAQQVQRGVVVAPGWDGLQETEEARRGTPFH